MTSGRELYTLIRTSGGIALEYVNITEAEFAAANGSSYTPPESGEEFSYRRINVARTIQILAECPGVIETFQTSAATVRLPGNSATEADNDAGNGRFFIIKNAGTGTLTIADYLGVTLFSLPAGLVIQAVSNLNQSWDFLFTASNTFFDNSTNGFIADNVQDAIEEIKTTLMVSASPGFTFGRSGALPANTWLYADTVPSNISGRTVYIDNGVVEKVFIAQKNAVAVKYEVYAHDGDDNNMTLLGSVTTGAVRSETFDVGWNVAMDKQLGIKIANDTANSGRDCVVGLLLSGTLV